MATQPNVHISNKEDAAEYAASLGCYVRRGKGTGVRGSIREMVHYLTCGEALMLFIPADEGHGGMPNVIRALISDHLDMQNLEQRQTAEFLEAAASALEAASARQWQAELDSRE